MRVGLKVWRCLFIIDILESIFSMTAHVLVCFIIVPIKGFDYTGWCGNVTHMEKQWWLCEVGEKS